jgi:ATP-binding protein involved in chromosome partitioning
VPLVQSVREAGDVGRPAVLQGNTPAARPFADLCGDFMQRLQVLENEEPHPLR